MSFTVDVATDLGKVRLLCTDTDSANPIFPDDSIQAFLDLEDGSVKLAAASALDAIASSEALVQKVIKIGDLQTNGAQTAKALREHAAALRMSVAEEPAFDIAELDLNDFSAREILGKNFLRGL